MSIKSLKACLPVALFMCTSVGAHAACDDLISGVIKNHLDPVLKGAPCPVVDKIGVDKTDHKLKQVCYESNGPTSKIRMDGEFSCHSSSESVVSKAVGGNNSPGFDENVTAVASIKGSDCSIIDVEVSPSGEGAKLLAKLFDAKGKARDALENALKEVCKKK